MEALPAIARPRVQVPLFSSKGCMYRQWLFTLPVAATRLQLFCHLTSCLTAVPTVSRGAYPCKEAEQPQLQSVHYGLFDASSDHVVITSVQHSMSANEICYERAPVTRQTWEFSYR